MPVYLYWGEDDFALGRAASALRDRYLDPDWASFNFEKILPDQPDSVRQALNQALTAPFGAGSRFVWLADTSICQRCPEDLLSELDRTLPAIPESSVLLLTTASKPDGRIKSTKLLQQHALEIREFSTIPPWKADLLMQQARQAAQEIGVKLTGDGLDRLVEAVGNNSRQLHTELEKLKLYSIATQKPIDGAAIDQLVTTSTQSSLQLATALSTLR